MVGDYAFIRMIVRHLRLDSFGFVVAPGRPAFACCRNRDLRRGPRIRRHIEPSRDLGPRDSGEIDGERAPDAGTIVRVESSLVRFDRRATEGEAQAET